MPFLGSALLPGMNSHICPRPQGAYNLGSLFHMHTHTYISVKFSQEPASMSLECAREPNQRDEHANSMQCPEPRNQGPLCCKADLFFFFFHSVTREDSRWGKFSNPKLFCKFLPRAPFHYVISRLGPILAWRHCILFLDYTTDCESKCKILLICKEWFCLEHWKCCPFSHQLWPNCPPCLPHVSNNEHIQVFLLRHGGMPQQEHLGAKFRYLSIR